MDDEGYRELERKAMRWARRRMHPNDVDDFVQTVLLEAWKAGSGKLKLKWLMANFMRENYADFGTLKGMARREAKQVSLDGPWYEGRRKIHEVVGFPDRVREERDAETIERRIICESKVTSERACRFTYRCRDRCRFVDRMEEIAAEAKRCGGDSRTAPSAQGDHAKAMVRRKSRPLPDRPFGRRR